MDAVPALASENGMAAFVTAGLGEGVLLAVTAVVLSPCSSIPVPPTVRVPR